MAFTVDYSSLDNVPVKDPGVSPVLATDWNSYVRDNFNALKYGHIVSTSSDILASTADEGTMAYATNNQKLYVFNGNSWSEVADLDNTGSVSDAAFPYLCPVGSVVAFAGSTLPSTGWLLCNGSEQPIATYAALSSVLGTTYGALTNGSGGVGTSHFRLPNLSGRGIVGTGTGAQNGGSGTGLISGGTALTARSLGGFFGIEAHTLGISEIPAHAHSVNPFATTDGAGGHSHTIYPNIQVTNTAVVSTAGANIRVALASDSTYSNRSTDGGYNGGSSTAGAHNHTIPAHNTNNNGSGGAHNNMAPSVVMNYIIKT